MFIGKVSGHVCRFRLACKLNVVDNFQIKVRPTDVGRVLPAVFAIAHDPDVTNPVRMCFFPLVDFAILSNSLTSHSDCLAEPSLIGLATEELVALVARR